MRLRPWAIGLFLIVGFGFFTAILFLIGDRHKAFERHVQLYTEFSNLGGLENGAKVRVSGLDAGELKRIVIPQNPSGRYRIELQVEEKVHAIVRMDSVASIETEGVVGDKFISIKKGTEQAPEARSGATLPSKEPLDLAALMEKGSGLLNDVHGTVTDLRGRMDITLDSINRTVNRGDTLIASVQPHIDKIARDGSEITGQIHSLTTDLNAGRGPAGMLLKDPATEQQLRATLSNVQQASSNVNEASSRANETMADFQSRKLIANAQVTLDNIQALSLQLNTTVQNALAADNMGQNGAENLRQTLSNLNRSTANLAEDTEALKHNFFFRGFFKKRGFYNLNELSPNEYAKACARQKCADARIWLQASNVFERDVNGQEQLSAAGRQQIDNEVAPEINALKGHVAVVEGYATDGSADQKYVDSRRRADLIRQYLEMHYHLNHSDVGIVAMQDNSPENSGRDRWNGAAVAMVGLRSKK